MENITHKRRGRPPNEKNSQIDSEEISAETSESTEGTETKTEKEVLSFGDNVKIKFRVDFDGSVAKDWYHKAQPTSGGIKCEAEKTEDGIYARIYDYGWWSLEMQYEGTEPIGKRLINRIGYDFAPPWEDKKTRKPKYFQTLVDAVNAITEFLNVQEKHNQQIENAPHAIQYNAPGRYKSIGI